MDSRLLTARERVISRAIRSIPVKHGRHRLLDKVSPRADHGPSMVRMKYSGTDLLMDVDDLVGWHFAALGSFDPEVAEVLCAVGGSSERTVFWDVGANKGACSYAVAAKLPHAQIVLIEPQPALQGLLEHNMARLAPGRYEVWPVGIGPEAGKFALTVPEGNKGRASLVHHGAGETILVQLLTAEELVGKSTLGWPTLVKIDVEGFEVGVLTSLQPAMENSACEAVVFENHQDEPEIFARLGKMFAAHDYQVYGINRTPFTTRLRPAPTLLRGVMDYAALRPDVAARPALRGLLRGA